MNLQAFIRLLIAFLVSGGATVIAQEDSVSDLITLKVKVEKYEVNAFRRTGQRNAAAKYRADVMFCEVIDLKDYEAHPLVLIIAREDRPKSAEEVVEALVEVPRSSLNPNGIPGYVPAYPARILSVVYKSEPRETST